MATCKVDCLGRSLIDLSKSMDVLVMALVTHLANHPPPSVAPASCRKAIPLPDIHQLLTYREITPLIRSSDNNT